MSNRPPIKKYGLGVILSIFTFVTIFGSIAFTQPAQAQFSVNTLLDLPRLTGQLMDKIKEGLSTAVMGAVQKAVSYFLRKLAHDSAVWLASGGKGQSPFAYTSSFSSYMQNVAGDAFGEAISELGKPFGLNLCQIPDVKVDLAVKIGLRAAYDAGGPKKDSATTCTWNSFVKSWGSGDAWKSKYGSGDALQRQFNVALKADTDSDMGIYLKSIQKIDNIVSNRTEEKKLERQEGQGFKGLTSLISGDVKTPAQIQKKGFEANTGEEQQKKSEAQIGSALGSGSFQILPSTLSLFLNTLATQMLKNFKEKGMLPFGVCVGEYGGEHCKSIGKDSVALFEGEGVKIGGREAAQAAFSEFLVANITTKDNYDILAQLNNCPDAPGLYNCRADSDLVQAIQEAKYGKPITIGEALEKKWIRPTWRLLSDKRIENIIDNTKGEGNCYNNAYCYSNIKVLRQVRILPLGFEIAALNSDPDNPWTIEQVIKGFNQCDENGNYDPVKFPFCHLIDPNWVLKIEPTRCNAFVKSSQPLMSGAPDRLEDCADLSSCVAYNKDGTCLSYGYCAREKNVWRFDADSCDAQYSTCKAFTDANGNNVAYLYRTLDNSYCNQNTVGCTAYSLNKDINGNWLAPTFNDSSRYYNNGIHFNSKVSSSCGSNSAGCTAFVTSTIQDGALYMRKAPDYLNCYDADANPSNGVQWPQNNADLARMQPKSECSSYAAVCTPLEVGCNMFTSILTKENIPGKFKPAEKNSSGQLVWNDQCDARCDGYAAYREMANNYSNGNPVAYIIPSSGAICTPEEEGCSSFTNMSEVVAGGEKVEYYSDLRSCIKPDANRQKNFYTYEGKKEGGYQLISYTLEKNDDGSPKYWYRTAADLAGFEARCNADGTNYKNGLADVDCRQFSDEGGHVYYRLLSQTIVVSDKCTYYRLNNSELASGGTTPTCFRNGEYKDGFCYYYGLPSGIKTTAGASRVCSASVESCHAYKGNAGNNTQQIFLDDFEGAGATPESLNWSASSGQVFVSTESTHLNGHSLAVAGSAMNLTKNIGNLIVGHSYVLTFWAKGDKQNVKIQLANNQTVDVGTFNVSDVWQYYTFSPAELAGTSAAAQLVFVNSGGQNIFIDNVRLVEVTNYLYRVRNSLKVDPVCDSNLNDNLPGEALGCSGYNVAGYDLPFYLTNFSYLCRDSAIGCTAVKDTFNTLDTTEPKAYNVWLSSNTPGTKTVNVGGQNFSCVVPVGEGGCYTNIAGFTKDQIMAVAGATFVSSTVYIPGDTPDATPLYLVANAGAICNSADLGCTYAGVETIGPSGAPQFATATIKNDPATYQDNLCQSEAVGCNAYSLGQGSYYFKDPAITGQKVCEYKSGVKVDGVLSSGWFWKNVGVCSGTVGATTPTYCSKKEDCEAADSCINIGSLPCYPNYTQTGNNFGLWSFGDKGKYNNFVGECPANQTGCTEFVDKNDQTAGSNGRSYFFLNNGKINAEDCDGLVSQKDGCILFDQTDKPAKLWDTKATYLRSEQKDSQKVEPVTDAGNKDANVIIKVARDRTCGEWLQCQSSHPVWDEKTSRWKQVCDQIGRCNQAPTTAQEDNITNCANYTDAKTNQYFGQVLTPELYQTRDTSWKGMDFSGYSLLNMYQPEELLQYNINSTTPDWRLIKPIACAGVNCEKNVSSTSLGCEIDGAECGKNGVGRCVNRICAQTPYGKNVFDSGTQILPGCRAYPEVDSPFPNTPEINRSQPYDGVNLCKEIKDPSDSTSITPNAFSCECDYTKATYGDGYKKLYFSFDNPNSKSIIPNSQGQTPQGLCVGGSKADSNCSDDSDCAGPGGVGGGTCELLKKESKLIGWHGYCLEPDTSRNLYSDPTKFACLSWLPVGTLSGVSDINSQHTEAGFNFENGGGKYYCLHSDGNLVQSSVFLVNAHEWWVEDLDLDNLSKDRAAHGIVLPSDKQYHRDEIDYIRLYTESSGGNDSWKILGKETSVIIRNGYRTVYQGNEVKLYNADNAEQTFSQIIKEPLGAADSQLVITDGTDNTTWKMLFDDGQGSGTNNFSFAADPAYKFSPQTTNQDDPPPIFQDIFFVKPDNSGGKPACTAPNDAYNSYQTDSLEACTESHDNKDDGCGFKAVFKDNVLTEIQLVCHTAAVESEKVNIKVFVGLKESCKQVAQTGSSPYDTVAQTNNLWQKNNFTVPFLAYNRSLSQTPFGSLGVGAISDRLISVFTAVPPVDKNLPVVGVPYSCGKICIDVTADPLDTNKLSDASNSSLSDGINLLSNLFPRLYKLWSWNKNDNGGQYVDKINPSNANFTASYGNAAKAPRVLYLGDCDASDRCKESKEGLTVNDVNNKNVILNTSPAKAILKFFAYADSNQMPLRSIKVDWGDGTNIYDPGDKAAFRNRRGSLDGICDVTKKICVASSIGGGSALQEYPDKKCTTSNDCKALPLCVPESSAKGFGFIDGQTCDNNYYRFDHVYTCIKDVKPYWDNSCAGDKNMVDKYGGCCVYKPKVQVKDNWGWCNGTCPGNGGGDGCYDGNDLAYKNECSVMEYFGSFTAFQKNILVAPR